jgi:head-tail adaptor
MEKCTMLDKTTVADGYGGFITKWTEGAEFNAAITLDTSVEAKRAEKEGVTGLYTVTTSRTLNLQYHDVFKRARDDKIFRVKSDGDDKLTPKSATLDMRQVSAEEWELPNG